NGLLMTAFLHPEALLQRLMIEAKHVCSRPCPPEERPQKIAALEQQLNELGYAEEALVSKAQDAGEGVVRRLEARPWHVVQVRIRTREVREIPPSVSERARMAGERVFPR